MSEAAAPAPFNTEDLLHTNPVGSIENGPVRVEALNIDNLHVIHAAGFAIQEAIKSPDNYAGKAPRSVKIKDTFVSHDRPHEIGTVYTYKDRRFGRKKHGIARIEDPTVFANDGADPQKASDHVKVQEATAVRKGVLKRRTVIATPDEDGQQQRIGYNKWGNARTVILKDSSAEDQRKLVRTKSLKPLMREAKVRKHALESLDRSRTYQGQKMAKEAQRYVNLQASVEGLGPAPTKKDLNWELRDVEQVPEVEAAAIRMSEDQVNKAFNEMIAQGDLDALRVQNKNAQPDKPYIPPAAKVSNRSQAQWGPPVMPPPPEAPSPPI